eukprot:743917-Lingulodinium_polyedra.AAC.1
MLRRRSVTKRRPRSRLRWPTATVPRPTWRVGRASGAVVFSQPAAFSSAISDTACRAAAGEAGDL